MKYISRWNSSICSSISKLTTVPKKVAGIIATIIPQILGENIANKKIDAETKVNRASEQAIYFFETLNTLRMRSEEKKSRNPINKIRRRMSSQSSVGSGSRGSQRAHRRTGSYSMKRVGSQNSNASNRSLNSIYSVDEGDDSTVATTSDFSGK